MASWRPCLPAARKRDFTSATKGEATPAFAELAANKSLLVVPNPKEKALVPASTRQRRLAAASRWHKAQLGQQLAASNLDSNPQTQSIVVYEPPAQRNNRRGEYDVLPPRTRTRFRKNAIKWSAVSAAPRDQLMLRRAIVKVLKRFR